MSDPTAEEPDISAYVQEANDLTAAFPDIGNMLAEESQQPRTSEITELKQTIKNPDPVNLLMQHHNRDNPLTTMPLNKLIQIFLENQHEIGIRQFAERCGMNRIRLKKIIADQVIATNEEAERVVAFFSHMSSVYERRALKKRATQAQASSSP